MYYENGQYVFEYGTTQLYELPLNIWYGMAPDKPLIDKFMGFNPASEKSTSFSINKYSIEVAYRKMVEFVYGEHAEEILEKYPTPFIDERELYTIKKVTDSGVYGICLNIANKDKPTIQSNLVGFAVTTSRSDYAYLSIRKYGLEEAWRRAVEHRYSKCEPLPTDDPSLKPEWWDMINPKYKTKTR